MPYLVIAFGLVLSCFGGLAMVNGSSIIQIERGWSLFIGGAALLSGGVVTIAVGIALKAVLDRVATLAPQAVALSGEAARPIAASDQALPALASAPADQRASTETRGDEPEPFEVANSDRGEDGGMGEVPAEPAPQRTLQPVPLAFDPTDAARPSSRATQAAPPPLPPVEDRRIGPGDRATRDGSMAQLPALDATDGLRTRDRLLRKPSRPVQVGSDLDDPTAAAEEVRDGGRNDDTGRAAASASRKPPAPERQDHAAQPFAPGRRRAVRHTRLALPRPHRSRAGARAGR